MTAKKRRVSCTFKRENTLEIQERIYLLRHVRLSQDGAYVPRDVSGGVVIRIIRLPARHLLHPLAEGIVDEARGVPVIHLLYCKLGCFRAPCPELTCHPPTPGAPALPRPRHRQKADSGKERRLKERPQNSAVRRPASPCRACRGRLPCSNLVDPKRRCAYVRGGCIEVCEYRDSHQIAFSNGIHSPNGVRLHRHD
jgi:hypothetical protein